MTENISDICPRDPSSDPIIGNDDCDLSSEPIGGTDRIRSFPMLGSFSRIRWQENVGILEKTFTGSGGSSVETCLQSIHLIRGPGAGTNRIFCMSCRFRTHRNDLGTMGQLHRYTLPRKAGFLALHFTSLDQNLLFENCVYIC